MHNIWFLFLDQLFQLHHRRLQFVTGAALVEVHHYGADALQSAVSLLQCLDGVGECRRLGAGGDSGRKGRLLSAQGNSDCSRGACRHRLEVAAAVGAAVGRTVRTAVE